MNLIQYLKNATYPHTGTPVIAFFGDSVTHGAFECLENEALSCTFDFNAVYHNQLRNMLLEVNPWLPVSIINAGVAGDHAVASLSRLDRDVIAHKPHLCVVNFCLNDVMSVALEDYLAALREIFTRLRAAGIPPILLTPNMFNTYSHPETVACFVEFSKLTAQTQKAGTLTVWVNAARDLAREMDVTIADAHAVWQRLEQEGRDLTMLLSNRINHPTREMHKVFAEAIFHVLDNDIE